MSEASMSEEDVAHIFGTSPRAGAWQPIETAPKTKKRILAIKGKTIKIVVYYPELKEWGNPQEWGDDGKWMPTHWMPLPAPPSTYQEWD